MKTMAFVGRKRYSIIAHKLPMDRPVPLGVDSFRLDHRDVRVQLYDRLSHEIVVGECSRADDGELH